MTVRVYRSTDTGAPQLSGQAGALVGVLDACLVNGYNSNNPPNSGWTIAFTGTNTRIYRQPTGSNQLYLRVDDTGAQNAQVFGCETATAIGTGNQTNLFPTTAQQASPGLYWFKSNVASSATRPWIVVATNKMFYLWVLTNALLGSATGQPELYWFGDIVSYKAATAGHQSVLVGSGRTYDTATNYVGATTYTATVTIDGVGYPISVLGSTIQTFQTLMDAINTAIGANGIAALIGGSILIQSATTGVSSTVAITAGTLFAAPLQGFTSVAASVAGTAATDSYSTVIRGGISAGYSSIADALSQGLSATTTGRFICRSATQAVGSVICANAVAPFLSPGTTAGNASAPRLSFPGAINLDLHVAPVFVIEPGNSFVRGILPGLWSIVNRGSVLGMSTITTGDRVVGSGSLAGKTFETVWTSQGSGQFQLEISDTW